MLLECPHESCAAVVIVEGNHPLGCGPLQCNGYTLHLSIFGGYFQSILLYVGPDLSQEEPQLLRIPTVHHSKDWLVTPPSQ